MTSATGDVAATVSFRGRRADLGSIGDCFAAMEASGFRRLHGLLEDGVAGSAEVSFQNAKGSGAPAVQVLVLGEAVGSGFVEDIGPEPRIIVVRLAERPVPQAVFQTLLDSVCPVIDAFRCRANLPGLIARKLKPGVVDPADAIAEAIVVQSAWSLHPLIELGRHSTSTTADHLRYFDPGMTADLADLLAAVTRRDATAIGESLRGVAVDPFGSSGATPLHIAVCFSHAAAVVARLIELGADANGASSDGTTPLIPSIWCDEMVAGLLLDSGADAKVVTQEGETALSPAAFMGWTSLADRLLGADAPVHYTNRWGGHPLIWAVRAGAGAIVEALLDKDPTLLNLRAGKYGIGSDGPCFAADASGVSDFVSLGRTWALSILQGHTALTAAAEEGEVAMVELLLSRHADPDVANTAGFTPIHFAAIRSSAAIASALIAAGAEVDRSMPDHTTALAAASVSGDLDVVGALLGAGASVDLSDGRGRTPLFEAAERDHAGVVEALLKAGAMKERIDSAGFNPLQIAAAQGSLAAVEVLLHAGCDADDMGAIDRTPVALVRQTLQPGPVRDALVRILIDYKADPWRVPPDGGASVLADAVSDGDVAFVDLVLSSRPPHDLEQSDALQSAIGDLPMLERLLNAGLGADIADAGGRTPLAMAAAYDQWDACELLLAHHADAWAELGDGDPPMVRAAISGRDRLCLDQLAKLDLSRMDGRSLIQPLVCLAALGRTDEVSAIMGRCSVNASSRGGWRPLSAACMCRRHDTIAMLMREGAWIDWMAGQPTPLGCAAEAGDRRIVGMLIEAGADVNATGPFGMTPLHFGCAKGELAIVDILLSSGAGVHARSTSGVTALHIAAARDDVEVALALLKAGARVDAQDEDGETPLKAARESDASSMVAVLLKAGASRSGMVGLPLADTI